MNEDIRAVDAIQSIQIGQDQKYLKIAQEHLAAVQTRNLQALGKTLHPDLQVTGPTGVVQNKASFLETYQKVFAHVDQVDGTVLERLKNQSTSIYALNFPNGRVPVTNVMTHEDDGLINKIEMVYDSDTLEKQLNPQK
ncbi:MAG TPA: nuclear transport factor 2 family protein [bacterium]|jgi:hypothetical protein|nr:nuclear transport factor 2 family protein [bacterium]